MSRKTVYEYDCSDVEDQSIEEEFYLSEGEVEEYETRKERQYREMLEELEGEAKDERKNQELDQWWEENKDKLRTAPKPTEDEIQKGYEEFQKLVEEDRKREAERKAKEEDDRIATICQWYESHKTTGIKLDMTLDEQWSQYEVEFVAEAEAKKARELAEAKKEAEKRLAKMARAERKATIARNRAKANRPNCKGKDQGRAKKEAERKAKEEEVKKQKALKESGFESTYMGKRAIHRVKKQKEAATIKIVPRDMTAEQPSIEEDEDEVVEEVPVPEPVVVVPVVVPEPIVKVEEPQEEEDDEEFAQAMAKVAGIKVAPKPAPKVVIKRECRPKVTKQVIATQFKGLIEQRIEEREAVDPQFKARMGGFKVLSGDKKKLDKMLKRTRMCNSVSKGEKCRHGAKCRFAHSMDQLQRRECAFALGCRLVKMVGEGEYNNCSKSDKLCSCWHPNETEASYCARLSIPITPPPAPTPAPAPVRLALKREYKAPSAPWAGVKSTPRPVARPTQVAPRPAYRPRPQVAPRPVAPETVIRCTADQVATISAALAGKTNFRIEVRD